MRTGGGGGEAVNNFPGKRRRWFFSFPPISPAAATRVGTVFFVHLRKNSGVREEDHDEDGYCVILFSLSQQFSARRRRPPRARAKKDRDMI